MVNFLCCFFNQIRTRFKAASIQVVETKKIDIKITNVALLFFSPKIHAELKKRFKGIDDLTKKFKEERNAKTWKMIKLTLKKPKKKLKQTWYSVCNARLTRFGNFDSDFKKTNCCSLNI